MGQVIDLTGNIYGRLLVLYRSEDRYSPSGQKRIYWHCKCECGNEKDILGSALRSGNTKSCGCLNKEKISERFKEDLTNKIFGRLTVIKDTGKREPSCGHIIWKCKCECGNEVEVNGASLRGGKTKSCGCINKERFSEYAKIKAKEYDLTGQRFGKLIVLEDDGKRNSQGGRMWKCQCDCGNITYVVGYSLKNGHTKSCGCIGKSYGEYLIENILKDNNILFEQQKTFDNCKFLDTNYPAYFDFYVNNKYIIEFDGSQHYDYKLSIHTWNTKENFIKTQEHDNFKNQYCFNNNIPIIRIPYTRINELCLQDLLLETSQFILKPRDT